MKTFAQGAQRALKTGEGVIDAGRIAQGFNARAGPTGARAIAPQSAGRMDQRHAKPDMAEIKGLRARTGKTPAPIAPDKLARARPRKDAGQARRQRKGRSQGREGR